VRSHRCALLLLPPFPLIPCPMRPLLLPSHPHTPTSTSFRSGIATLNERRPRGPRRGGRWPWILGRRPQGLGRRAWPRCRVASRRRRGLAGLPAADPVAWPRRGIGVGPRAGAARGCRALDGAAGPRAPPWRAGSEEEDEGPTCYIPVKAYFLPTR
jgi:hypothetical protein